MEAWEQSRHIHVSVAKELQMAFLAFDLCVVGDVHDNELTRLFVFDPNRVATAGQNREGRALA